MNLFWSTRALTQSKEDHLTEFFAAALTLNHDLRDAYTECVLDIFAQCHSWKKPVIMKVETQVSYEGINSCPDMRITLTDGHVILSNKEHFLWRQILENLEIMNSFEQYRATVREYFCRVELNFIHITMHCDGIVRTFSMEIINEK